MKNKVLIVLFFYFSFFPHVSSAALSGVDSVVKIFVTSNPMDYYRPWQSRGISASTGSGAVIDGNRILTNAHVIADSTFIQVKKEGDPKKYTAKVIAVGHDCDLALLSVDDANFFKNTIPLKLGGLPELQDTVTVIGYPEGGDKISITEGIVSRIEVTSYSQSARKLLAVQIDAAINPGNSGGPVLKDGKVVGIAMQVLQAGQNIGYIIPVPIINHFFTDLKDGRYDGFPILGIEFTNTENNTLRKFFQIEKQNGGLFISSVLPHSPAIGIIKKNDVILKIDGVPIGEDGTFHFRNNERLTISHLITEKQVNESIKLEVVRDGGIINLEVKLIDFVPLIPPPEYFKYPPYYIYGGLVFTVLSSDLLQSWGSSWWKEAPENFTHYLIGKGRYNMQEKKEVVVLLHVLSDEINAGYHNYGSSIIEKVNDKTFSSFKEFVQLLNEIKNSESYAVFETETYHKLILDNRNIDKINAQILMRNNIPLPFSDDVRQWIVGDSL